LIQNNLGPDTLEKFIEVINKNKTIKYLDFSDNDITHGSIEIMLRFLEALKTNKTLRTLNVARNGLNEMVG